ncbi:hypothetical protein BDN72DRAFT_836092 [Pluteus cervinus]|uniref:Uncharacterized protein n=1 Tax=Pluteus cervinus TaxID=181527 RepID=A0ACD3B3B3_9AGAR|nr:hypothetical protein BDN72DRAFT_836092 [Pluteus cervinus]
MITEPAEPRATLSRSNSAASTSHRRAAHNLNRKKSLCLPNQPLHVPVPPSLLQSPYLNSPQSIFQRAASAPRLPSEEDEEWLQDTVPLSSEIRESHHHHLHPSTDAKKNAAAARPNSSIAASIASPQPPPPPPPAPATVAGPDLLQHNHNRHNTSETPSDAKHLITSTNIPSSSNPSRGRSTDARSHLRDHIPASPPLVHWRKTSISPLASSSWPNSAQTTSRSDTSTMSPADPTYR